jgi:hypothetical protein
LSIELFNLADDPYEKKKLAEIDPDEVRELNPRH